MVEWMLLCLITGPLILIIGKYAFTVIYPPTRFLNGHWSYWPSYFQHTLLLSLRASFLRNGGWREIDISNRWWHCDVLFTRREIASLQLLPPQNCVVLSLIGFDITWTLQEI
jgi:hypothetical protein